jgi:hypothetical protein
MAFRQSITLALVAHIGLFSSVASAGEWMTGEQIQKLISGNTTYGKHELKGFTSYSYNREDGTSVGWNSDSGAIRGTWRVQGNKICRQTEGREESCHEVKDNGDGTYSRYVQPKNLVMPRRHVFTWTKVVPGNPENLQ